MTMLVRTCFLPHVEATLQLGRCLADEVPPRLAIALRGDLGAGKTMLVRGLAEGLNAEMSAVNSPTFLLLQRYDTPRVPLYHCDAYRLRNIEEFLELGMEELFADEAVCVIEWADRVESALPEDRLKIELRAVSEQARRADFQATGPVSAALLERLVAVTESAAGDTALVWSTDDLTGGNPE